MEKLIRCEIIVDEADVEILWGLLALHISFGWEEESLATGETCFRIYCESKEFIDTLCLAVTQSAPMSRVELLEVPNEDWTKAWREFFTPIACGTHFLVLPPWLASNTELQGRTPIVIEPKSAFGTGHHSTTALCLEAISSLIEKGRIQQGMEFLDLGTGSGILGLGCCHFGLFGVGTDIDTLAVDNALENRELNGIPAYDATKKQGFDVVHGSTEILSGRKFDLVLANILAKPLKELAEDIIALRNDCGCIILSGLLVIQAKDVEAAYTALGLPAAKMITEGDWAALIWE